MAGTGYAKGIIPRGIARWLAIIEMENEERDENMEQPRPELPADEVQDKAKGGFFRMLGCCSLAIALLRVLWELL